MRLLVLQGDGQAIQRHLSSQLLPVLSKPHMSMNLNSLQFATPRSPTVGNSKFNKKLMEYIQE